MPRLICGMGGLSLVLLAVTAAHSQPPGRGPGRDGPPPPLRGPLFVALDKDQDGELSAEEIQSAAESLKTLDKNGDGKLTADELRPERGGPPGRRPDGARPADRGGDRASSDRPAADRSAADRGAAPERGAADRGARDARRDGSADRAREGAEGRSVRGADGPLSILPLFAREGLQLTEEQRRQCDELDAEIREKLGKILTAEQKQQLQQARRRGADGPRGTGRDGPPPRASREGGPEGGGPLERDGRPPEGRGPREEGGGRPAREG